MSHHDRYYVAAGPDRDGNGDLAAEWVAEREEQDERVRRIGNWLWLGSNDPIKRDAVLEVAACAYRVGVADCIAALGAQSTIDPDGLLDMGYGEAGQVYGCSLGELRSLALYAPMVLDPDAVAEALACRGWNVSDRGALAALVHDVALRCDSADGAFAACIDEIEAKAAAQGLIAKAQNGERRL